MDSDIKNESGMTLVESMIAILILLSGLLAMAQVLTQSIILSKTHGRDSGITTIYARDKMEQLMALDYGNSALTAGQNTDYLNQDGSAASAESGVYTRQWQITDKTSPNRKEIVVTVNSTHSLQSGVTPSTALITEKTQ